MRWIILAFALLFSTGAQAQCSGVAPANTLCGNLTGSPNVPRFYSASGAITGNVDPNYVPVGGPANVLQDGFYLAPIGGLTLLASPAGAGNCITSACTLPTACSFVKQIGTFIGAPSIQLADGTYTTADANNMQCHVAGNGGGSSSLLVNINGNSITPANVNISLQSSQSGFYAEDGAEMSIGNLEISAANGSGTGITGRQSAVIDYHGISWGSWGNSGSHVSAFGNAVIINPGNETLLANTTFILHWNLSQGAYLIPSGTTTIQSTVAWSQFVSAVNVNIDTTGWTLSGNGTGQQFTGLGVGYLNANGSCASTFPGTGGCTLSRGFLTSNGDLQTDGKLLNSAMPTPTRAGDIGYNNGSGWWQSVAGCNSANGCVLTENSSGAPALAAAGAGLGANTGALVSNASVIDTYTEGTLASVNTVKGGFTLWPRLATVDNLAASTNLFTCSGNPTITMYECGTDVACGSPTTIGAITLAAAGRVYANSSGLSAITISAGDFTAWGLTGTCTSIDVIGKAQIHMN